MPVNHLEGVPHRIKRFRKQKRYMDEPAPGGCVLWAATAEVPRLVPAPARTFGDGEHDDGADTAAEAFGSETLTRVGRNREQARRLLNAAVRERGEMAALIAGVRNLSAAAIRAMDLTRKGAAHGAG